jgi:hypothetical protein
MLEHDAQASALQDLLSADFTIGEFDTPGDVPASSEVDHQRHPAGRIS